MAHRYEERYIENVLCFRHFPKDEWRPIEDDLARNRHDIKKLKVFKERFIRRLQNFQ